LRRHQPWRPSGVWRAEYPGQDLKDRDAATGAGIKGALRLAALRDVGFRPRAACGALGTVMSSFSDIPPFPHRALFSFQVSAQPIPANPILAAIPAPGAAGSRRPPRQFGQRCALPPAGSMVVAGKFGWVELQYSARSLHDAHLRDAGPSELHRAVCGRPG